MRKTVESWVEWADDRLEGAGLRVHGARQRRPPEVDELLANGETVEVGKATSSTSPSYELASSG